MIEDIQYLFALANLHRLTRPHNTRRLQGRHCRARLQRAQAKRTKLNRGHGRIVSRTPYTP